jgi:hypothetical protein
MPAGEILVVAGLLAHQHHPRGARALAKDGLCAARPEWATATARRRVAQSGQCAALG